jgi:hypothetical protein
MLHAEKLCKERTGRVNCSSVSEAEMLKGGENYVVQRCKHTLPTFTSSSGGILKALDETENPSQCLPDAYHSLVLPSCKPTRRIVRN